MAVGTNLGGKAGMRLEWIPAGGLTENPANWRRHSQEQLQSLREPMSDPDVGWAGACLYNERTKRLIDGHARKSITDPSTPVPVLVGDWSEEAEAKLLATLDPLGAMARGDAEAYAALVANVQADGLWVRDLLHNTQAGLLADEPGEDDATLEASLEEARNRTEALPDYAFDCHTSKGKRSGKTKADFFRDEQAALNPKQVGLFDDLSGGKLE